MKDQELLEQISKKLSALLELSMTKDVNKLGTEDRVRMLVRIGFRNQDIADILGTTRQTIEVLKSRIKKSNKK